MEAGEAARGARGRAVVCNICRETPQRPVVTLCGHVHCWACVQQWRGAAGDGRGCPVCRRPNGALDVVPLHERGATPCYRGAEAMRDAGYRGLLGDYERELGDLVVRGSERNRYFFRVGRLHRRQLSFCWWLLACLAVYCGLGGYK